MDDLRSASSFLSCSSSTLCGHCAEQAARFFVFSSSSSFLFRTSLSLSAIKQYCCFKRASSVSKVTSNDVLITLLSQVS
jgi:hypothetical protein